jgi:hypothetical protein
MYKNDLNWTPKLLSRYVWGITLGENISSRILIFAKPLTPVVPKDKDTSGKAKKPGVSLRIPPSMRDYKRVVVETEEEGGDYKPGALPF